MVEKTIAMTGTRQMETLTVTQLEHFARCLSLYKEQGFGVFRHGDCVGADEKGHQIAVSLGYRVYIHPPTQPTHRAFCESLFVVQPAEYLFRNQAMVNQCDVLLALPKLNREQKRSGTWMTIRMARKINLPIVIFYPDGHIVKENHTQLF